MATFITCPHISDGEAHRTNHPKTTWIEIVYDPKALNSTILRLCPQCSEIVSNYFLTRVLQGAIQSQITQLQSEVVHELQRAFNRM